MLHRRIPLAVLKLDVAVNDVRRVRLHRRIPLAVLKHRRTGDCHLGLVVAQANTACGIETSRNNLELSVSPVAQANTACGIETKLR